MKTFWVKNYLTCPAPRYYFQTKNQQNTDLIIKIPGPEPASSAQGGVPYLLHNAPDLGLEAHVQHPVRLVKAEVPDR